MAIVQPVRFASDVRFTQSNDYCLCLRPGMHAQVMITSHLKELIEQKRWDEVLPADLEELRSLRELGFLEEERF